MAQDSDTVHTPQENSEPLARRISLPLLTLYGLGTIIGAGIYVLVGEVAAQAGMYAPISFIVAATIAGFTAFSYAELSSHFPKSAGEAVYVSQAFRQRWLATAVGLAVVTTGIVSSATIANGFVGYLSVFVEISDWIAIAVFVLALGGFAAWGISESLWVASIITVLSIAGLLAVVFVAGDNLADIGGRMPELVPPMSLAVWTGITLGAFLAFYAFIGFEDMVNIAEEVNNPRRNLPLSIVIALIFATILYVILALIAVLTLPVEQLSESEAPIVSIVEADGRISGSTIAVLSLLSVTNSALAQIIMSSRILYGMARQNTLPRLFASVHSRTHTPVFATVVVSAFVLILALWLPLVTLAEITSSVIVMVFALVNASLFWLRVMGRMDDSGVRYPQWVPVIGMLLCVGFLVVEALSKAAM